MSECCEGLEKVVRNKNSYPLIRIIRITSYMCVSGVRNVNFGENLAFVLNEQSPPLNDKFPNFMYPRKCNISIWNPVTEAGFEIWTGVTLHGNIQQTSGNFWHSPVFGLFENFWKLNLPLENLNISYNRPKANQKRKR